MLPPLSSDRFAAGPVVATIGVFDGVHRGHRALLEAVLARAAEIGATPVAISFHPHPIEILAREVPSHRLASREQKLRALAELGFAHVWLLPFSPAMAQLSPCDFVAMLLRRIELREIWVGADFRFGNRREGTADLLRECGRAGGFSVEVFSPVLDAGNPWSSSRVREALRRGEVEEAGRVLGRTYLLEGRVGFGRGEGGKVLVPTANLVLPAGTCLPARGVYAGWSEVDGTLVASAINVGRRPTLTDDAADTVEVHLIDWNGDLRGKLLPVYFAERVRPEIRFDGLAALRAAVARDIEEVRSRLQDRAPESGGPVAPRTEGIR